MSEKMRKDIDGNKTGLSALNTRVDASFARLDGDISDIRGVNRRIISTLVRLEGKMDDMAERMATKDDISGVNSRIDGLAGRLDDIHFRWANHEERISSLEKRRS